MTAKPYSHYQGYYRSASYDGQYAQESFLALRQNLWVNLPVGHVKKCCHDSNRGRYVYVLNDCLPEIPWQIRFKHATDH